MITLLDKLPPVSVGLGTLRWSLVVIFVFFGVAKFAAYEAQAIEAIGTIHPMLSWLYPIAGVQGASNVVGSIELVTAVMLVAGAWSHRAGLIGGAMGCATFLITLSFALGAPLWQDGYGFPFMGSFAQFLFKDVVLLSACLTLALHAAQEMRSRAA